MARIELSNIGGGGTTLSLTTTGTSGASTLAGSVLNIPVYQGQLTLTTTGTSGAATLSGDVLNIPQYSGGGAPAGAAGQVQFNSTPAGSFAASANLAWDNAATQLNIGTPISPTGTLNVRGGGTLTTVNLRLTNSGNTELLKVLDNGSTNIGTAFNWDNVNNRLGIGTASPAVNLDVVGRMNLGGNFTLTANTPFSVLGSQSNRRIINGTAAVINQQIGYLSGAVDFDGAQGFSNAASLNFTCNNRSTGSGNVIGAGRFTFSNDGPTSALQEGYGVLSRILNYSTVTAGSMRLFYADYIDLAAGSTVTDLYLIDANLRANLGTITNTYGVFVGDITKGTQTNTPYSFYASDADSRNYFAGNTSIGVIIPSARLHVRGSNASSGTNALLVQNSTPSDIYKIENDGKISYWATNTAAGTTGAQTIDRPSGTVNFGIGDSALVVTNSLCTTSSIVFATVRTNDATAYIKNVVPAAGSFTINLGAAATAETSVGFFIIN